LDAEPTFVLALRKRSREWLQIRKAEAVLWQVNLWMKVNGTYDETTPIPNHNAPRLIDALTGEVEASTQVAGNPNKSGLEQGSPDTDDVILHSRSSVSTL
jgi:hypothetical protein